MNLRLRIGGTRRKRAEKQNSSTGDCPKPKQESGSVQEKPEHAEAAKFENKVSK